MNFDILELLNSTLGGPLIRQASSFFGETEHSTHSALRTLEPALLVGVMQQAATPAGADELFENVTSERVDAAIAAKLPRLFGNRGSLEALLDNGEALADTVLGNRTGSVTNAIAQVSGVKPDSALALVSLATPVLFGVMKKYVTQNDVNASGLAAALMKQRRALENSQLDDRIVSALGFGSRAELLDALPAPGMTHADLRAVPAAPIRHARERAWIPWAVAAGVAVLGLLFFVNRTAERHEAETASLPAATDRMQLAAPTKVYFAAGDTSIDPEDRRRIASAAESAITQGRSVAITGYTNRTGDGKESVELARDRADAVRDALLDAGIGAEKIVMDPPALVTSSAKDEEARRVDIDVR